MQRLEDRDHPHRGSRRVAVACLLVTLLLDAARGQTDNWPQFRGARGDGTATHVSIPTTWSKTDNVVWRTKLPDRGNASPIIWKNRVFVPQAISKDNRRTLLCFDTESGDVVWQSGVKFDEAEPTNSQNPYCSGTAATDGQRVVVSFGSAGLYCYDFAGRELWHRDFGSIDSWHGSGSSPILHDGVCYFNFGPGTESALYACDAETGNVIWKHDAPKQPRFAFGAFRGFFRSRNSNDEDEVEQAEPLSTPFTNAARSGNRRAKGGFNGSWCTPIILEVDGQEQLVLVESTRVAAYEPKSGSLLWSHEGLPPQVFASPAVGDGVLVAMGHESPSGAKVVAIKLGGELKKDESRQLWQLKLPRDCVASPVIRNGNLFLVQENGIARCLDVTTGEKRWAKRLRGKGSNGGVWASLICVDESLIVANLSGDVFVLDARADFKIAQQNDFGDEVICGSPAIANGRIYIRSYEALWCLGRH